MCVWINSWIYVCSIHVHCLYLHLFVFTAVVPNAKEIKAARWQRRANRAQKEFISLGRDGHSSAGSTPDHYSREDDEDRVDDDDDEPDDHERRIEFAPRLKSIRERIADKLGMKSRENRLYFSIFCCSN